MMLDKCQICFFVWREEMFRLKKKPHQFAQNIFYPNGDESRLWRRRKKTDEYEGEKEIAMTCALRLRD